MPKKPKTSGAASDGSYDLSITTIPTKKDKIKQPFLSEHDVIPRINSSVLFVGASGSGKTTVLANLMTRKDMLGSAFDRVFLFSPTALTDDIQGYLGLDEDDICDNMKDVPDILDNIMDDQREQIQERGAHRAPKYCIIFDDVVADRDLMKADQFTKCFIMCRHFNLTTLICSQSYKQIPRKCRLQANNIIYFAGSNSENEAIIEDRCPPNYTRKDGLKLVAFATREKYSFLHINMRVPFDQRYRRNFDEVIHVDDNGLEEEEKEEEGSQPESKKPFKEDGSVGGPGRGGERSMLGAGKSKNLEG